MFRRTCRRAGAAFCFGAAAAPSPAPAGAWTQAEDAGIVISKVEYATADAAYDGAGAPAAGEFRKLHSEAYVEYGVTDWLTAVGQFDYDTSWLETEGETTASESVSRYSLWGRVRLWRGETDVVSVQAGVELPGDRSGVNTPALGAEPAAITIRALFGRGFSTGWGGGFLDLQGGLDLRDEDAPAQAVLDLTAGQRLFDDFLLMGQVFNTYSLDQRAGDAQDYDQTTGALSVGWKFDETSTILLGASADLATRNLEPMRSVFVSLWRTF